MYITDVTFEGGSGHKYTFQAYTTDHEFSDVGAVYIFTRAEDTSYPPLYTGETRELSHRIKYHEQWACVRRYNVNSICVLFNESRMSRLGIETDLLEMGKPPCND